MRIIGSSENEETDIKKRRTTNVLVEQPSQEDMVVLDNVPDNTFLWEEVCIFVNQVK